MVNMLLRLFCNATCVAVVLVLLKDVHITCSTESMPWIQPSLAERIPNVTVSAGRDVSLSCEIENLGFYRVAWSHKERRTLLSIQNRVISKNSRFSVTDINQRIWYLHIKAVTEQDAGQYMCQINTSPMISQSGFLQVVVAPYIDEDETVSEIDVREGEDAFMKCSAKGSPKPDVKWRRQNNMDIPKGKDTVQTVQGEYLNLTKTSRLNMGVYLCTASNGIPPVVNKRIILRVNFPPMVWIPNQLVGASLGSDVTLDCNLESNPHPVTFWMKESGQVVISGTNYNSFTSTSGQYKLQMSLIIRNMRVENFGSFTCVAKNTLGETAGTIRVYEIPQISRKETYQLANTPSVGSFDVEKEPFRLNVIKENQENKGKSSELIIDTDILNSGYSHIYSSILILLSLLLYNIL